MSAPYRMMIALPSALRATGNALAYQVTGVAVDQQADTYSLPLSESGSGEATHYACATVAGEEMVARMTIAVALNAFPGIIFYRWDDATGLLLSTSSARAATIIETEWGWDQSLADAGLKLIIPAIGGQTQ